jgi:pimeloyl-ACP methyl ester carboxylesterase
MLKLRYLMKRLLFPLILLSHFGFAQQAIERKEMIMIGGIRQAIWIKGNDDSKPLLLFLHGGPGNSVMPYAEKFCNKLYQHFVVVHWDQRETGETLKANSNGTTLTLKMFQTDTEQLVDSLLHRFGRTKLYVAAHSWGTALGFHLVKARPQQIEAFVAIGSMVNQIESEKVALSLMRAKASTLKNVTETANLSHVEIPFKTGAQLYHHRRGLLVYHGSRISLKKSYVDAWAEKWLGVFNEASRENLFESLPDVKCPVYFMAGRNDLQTNSALAERYYQKLVAPAKGFFWFENAGHNIPSANGQKMQEIIIEKVLHSSGAL